MIADDVARAVVAGAVALLTPFVLSEARTQARASRRIRVAWFAGAPAAASFLLSPGTVATALVAPYALFCAWIAATAGVRILERGFRPAHVLVANLAQVYLGGAAVWLVAHRAGYALLGYPPLWVLLTAAHFHVAGFYLTTVAALHRRAGIALLVALAIPLTAIGIEGPRWLETFAALATTAGAMGVAVIAISSRRPGRPAPRAWIRTFADGRAMYVAAYATHATAGTAYMNIAFPLPGGHLASILRLDNLPATAGVWMHDDPAAPAELRALAPPGATSIARHDLWLCGVHYLTLDYAMLPAIS